MSLRLRSRVVLFGLAALCAGVSLPARSAFACLNGVQVEVNESVAVLVESEGDLAHGRPGAAVQKALQRFPDLKTEDGDRLTRRARRIVATAIARMDGLLAVRGFEASTSDQRRANLEWSVATLRAMDRQEKNSPVLRAELAEALSTLPEHLQEAFDILNELSWREVMPSSYGYRALARLRRMGGDEVGERLALNEALKLQRPDPPSDPAAWGFE